VILVLILVWRLIGVPVVRFLRLPTVLTPPKAPAKREDWKARHIAARYRFLERYLAHAARNPLLEGSKREVRAAARAAAEAARRPGGDGDEPALGALLRFERERVDPLLAPLDREVDKVIRSEALAVGVSTAVSPNGTLDAFLVLWRNANLVSRIANVYYGKPGARGSLRILRDVSAAALLATYLEGLTEAAGGLLRGVLGSVAGVVAGPVVDGSVNALATLRIGYLAKARCRSFKAWTDSTRKQALADALAAAKARSGEVVSEVAKAAGSALGGITGAVGDAMKGGVGLLRKLFGGTDPEPGGAS
jgi:hypothetical protein